ASARKKKGDSASSTTTPTPTPTTTAESAPRLSASAKELKETGIGGDGVRESGGESKKEKETSEEEE
nr:hypothetical protein [Tanacetum cinerariifolium]